MNPRSVTGRAVGLTALCLAAMVVCFGLAWWQWDRFSSAGGTFQNLGYVLQWPLFGLFPAFMVWRWRVLSRRSGEESAGASGAESSGAGHSTDGGHSTDTGHSTDGGHGGDGGYRGDSGDSEDPADAELAAYNRYLAELYARDHEVK
ncbi:hypothetical protein GCM10009676_03140 [Prauserella halophila]|uniref:DNA-binding transcriptional regulator of glucitol operon n=1 Tax=Prauserella halophila TaxID=185641 RepID=A0ABN1VYJ9_9PSEU|nr:transcriptional regulator [Prauserella halophila]MCP2234347.1 hypothetical protein [Prauserella halophila]